MKTRPTISIPVMTLRPSMAASAKSGSMEAASLPHAPEMEVERPREGLVARLGPCRIRERSRVSPVAQRLPRLVERARSEEHRRRRPGRAVAADPVGAELRAERDQLRQVGHGRNVV